MATLDFPSSPALDDTYTANGRSWKWDGVSWVTITTFGIVRRVVTVPDASSITVDADSTDLAVQINTQPVGALTINAPTGTPIDGQQIMLRIKSNNVQTFSWNAIFSGSVDSPLPTATSGSGKYDYLGFSYNSTLFKWQLVAKNFGF